MQCVGVIGAQWLGVSACLCNALWTTHCFLTLFLQIKKIRLGHDGTGIGAGWFIDDLVIDVPSNGESYRFAMHRWLAEDEEDGKTEIELEPTDITEKDKCESLLGVCL